VSAERELRPNYEILVLRACFQVSFAVFSILFFGSNKTEVELKLLAGLFSRAENIHVSWCRRNLD